MDGLVSLSSTFNHVHSGTDKRGIHLGLSKTEKRKRPLVPVDLEIQSRLNIDRTLLYVSTLLVNKKKNGHRKLGDLMRRAPSDNAVMAQTPNFNSNPSSFLSFNR